MSYCVARGCSNHWGMGKKLHRFPADPERRKEWEIKIRRSNWKPTKNSYVCADHFEETQYENRRADGKRRLKPYAVPTLFAVTTPTQPQPGPTMPGGRRKSRKPQKWEDFVADEEQLASLEKEMEKEEKARMLTMEGAERERETEDSSDDENNLKIVVEDEETCVKEEEEEEEVVKEERVEGGEEEETIVKEEVENEENGGEVPEAEKDEPRTPSPVGDCNTCGIQLRDWPSTHSHLRFHRLSHVPECIMPAANTKRINCQVCQRSCQTREVLAYHAYTEHYVKMRQAKTCPFCCLTFSCLDDFLDHLDITNITFRCQMCGLLVKQEHKFYQHLVYCYKKNNSGLTSLPCCVCGIVTKINRLYDHLTHHSTQLNMPCHLSSTNPRLTPLVDPCPPKQQTRFRPFVCEMCDRRFVVYSEYKRHLLAHTKSRSYVCTHCGRSYCQKNTLIVHLYSYHNSSPNAEEVMPKEEMAKRRCEECDRTGFASEELLVRHCIMRCPRRNNLQASFAVIVASIAKNQNIGFVETLHSPAMVTYLKLGLEAWHSTPCVREYLEVLQSDATSTTATNNNSNNNNTSTTGDLTATTTTTVTTPTATTTTTTSTPRKDSMEFTDIQLLAYLTQFEEKNREKDKELEMLMNYKSKGGGEGEESTSPQLEEVEERVGGMEESLLPFLCTTTTTTPSSTPCSPPPPYPTASPQISHSSLMQHLRRGSNNGGAEKRGSDQGGGGQVGEGGGPVDICLVTSTTNTQVTITPAGHHLTQDVRPPKIAKVLSHKPPVAEIKALYPGVCVLGDVDFTRLPSLLLEMRECMSDRVEREMEAAGIIPQDLQRLEVEAQLLREAEPFYLEEYPRKKEGGENHLCGPPSPSTLQHLAREIREMCNGEGEENVPVLSPSTPDSLLRSKVENGLNITQQYIYSPASRHKAGEETIHPNSLFEKFVGVDGLTFPSSIVGAFPSQKIVSRLLREAQILAES